MQSWGTSTSQMDYSRLGPAQDHVLGHFQPSLRDSLLERAVLTQTLLQLFKQLFALTRSEEAVGLDPMLAGIQVVVAPFQRIKGGVRAPLQDQATLDHQDLISPADGREPVGDHERSAPLHQVAEAILNHGIRFRIKRRSRFIEDE